MNPKLPPELEDLQETIRKAQQLPRPLVWSLRIAFMVLFLVWLGGAVYLHLVVKEDERAIARIQQQAQQKEDRLRREAAYRQFVLQLQNPQNKVRNAVDGVKK